LKRIAIYARRSIYSEESESIKMQVEACKEYFRREKCEFEVFTDEGFSGSNIDRPAFKRMLNKIHSKEFDAVVVYKIDRISRNMVDFINLVDDFEKYDVPLISVTEGADPTTPAGKFVMNILASVAEMERANIQQRVTDNMLMLAKQGRWTGGNTPIGYKSIRIRNGVYLTIDKDKRELVENIFDSYIKCNSLNEVSRTYDINIASLSDMLSSPVYVGSSERVHKYLKLKGYDIFGVPNGKGYLTYGKRPKVKNKKQWKTKGYIAAISIHEPIIDEDRWLLVQETLEKNSVEPKPKESNNSYLNNLVKCAVCGANMFINQSYIRVDGTKVYSFRCSNRKRKSFCTNGMVMVKELEKSIEDKLRAIGLNKNLIDEYLDQPNSNNYDKEIKYIKNKINNNNLQISNLTDKLALISNDAAGAIINKIEELTISNRKLQKELFSYEKLESSNKNNDERINELYNSIQLFNTMGNADIEDKRKLIRTIIEKIDFDKATNTAKITLLI